MTCILNLYAEQSAPALRQGNFTHQYQPSLRFAKPPVLAEVTKDGIPRTTPLELVSKFHSLPSILYIVILVYYARAVSYNCRTDFRYTDSSRGVRFYIAQGNGLFDVSTLPTV